MGAHVCPWWLGYAIDNPLRRVVHRPEAIVRGHVRRGARVLDVGCGMGLFALAMARMVGPEGRVLAVDVQPRMLDVLRRRAERAGLAGRIETRRCQPDAWDLGEAADFALAFWMVHETDDARALLGEMRRALAPQGRLLVAEPLVHVSARAFEEGDRLAREVGFALLGRPRIPFSHTALYAPVAVS